jgi:hypothetical protein
MGLEASVLCSCYAEGKTTPFPLPVPERFYIDEAGFPNLAPGGNGDDDAEQDAFNDWLDECCEHPGMAYTQVYVSNWHDYNAFIRALENAGAEHFPVLLRELPETNDGLTSAESAAEALRELDYFRTLDKVDQNIFMVNGETGERLYAYVPEHGGIFVWDGRHGHNIGLDRDGVFIEDAWELSRVVFRARRLEQLVTEPTEPDTDPRVVFTDLDSERRFECKTPIPGKEIPWPDGRMRNDEGGFRLEYPRLLNVETQALPASYFASITDSLVEVFSASVTTGNPVRWH